MPNGLQVRQARAGRAVLARIRSSRALASYYEAATTGRRTAGWRRVSGGPNEVGDLSLARLRDVARDLVRNNGHARSALQVIEDDVVGWGIRASERTEAWKEWSQTTACDADGRCDFAGLQQTVMRGVVESGEQLIRRRRRRLTDGLPLPLQLQILEPDHLDSSRHQTLPNGGRIIRGIELDPIGRRAAYWLYPDHPGSSLRMNLSSVRVPASEILHVFRPERPGQVRGVTWFAPSLMRLKDFDDLADATLMKQRVAAVLAALTFDTDEPVGAKNPDEPTWDMLEPGLIAHLPGGRGVEVVQPPSVRDYPEYARFTINEIASGIGVTPEDMTGDYGRMTFSSARISRIRHFGRVSGWRWRMLVPQMLDPVWRWAMQAAMLAGEEVPGMRTNWTAPGLPMIRPEIEGLAIIRNVRAGITTHSEEIRARGYNPDEFLDELERDFKELDARGLTLDSDPRKMTQAGQLHGTRDSGSAAPAALVDTVSQPLSEWLGGLDPDLADRIMEAAAENVEREAA